MNGSGLGGKVVAGRQPERIHLHPWGLVAGGGDGR